MRLALGAALGLFGSWVGLSAPFSASINSTGNISWADAFSPGAVEIEIALAPKGPWLTQSALFGGATGQVQLSYFTDFPVFYRLRAFDLSPTPAGFSDLTRLYGNLETVAGGGLDGVDGINYWLPSFENGPAIEAALSRPHFAQADNEGNIFIVDKSSHSVLKVTTDGKIHTYAGTHTGGYNGDGPASALSLQLNSPNGLWVRPDGIVYVLDTDNGRVRRIDKDGSMRTIFKTSGKISTGRGLWVAYDESVIYYCAGTAVKQWTSSGGTKTVRSGFVDLGNLVVSPQGDLVVTDRGANQVYRMPRNGNSQTVIAGNGTAFGGDDGSSALDVGLYGVRGVWFLPNGGYLLATHEGSRVWYVDTAGIAHLFLEGPSGGPLGDGEWFYNPGPKVTECRSIAVAPNGDILIVEDDRGYVRRIRLYPLNQP
jgi:hypothetical protein